SISPERVVGCDLFEEANRPIQIRLVVPDLVPIEIDVTQGQWDRHHRGISRCVRMRGEVVHDGRPIRAGVVPCIDVHPANQSQTCGLAVVSRSSRTQADGDAGSERQETDDDSDRSRFPGFPILLDHDRLLSSGAATCRPVRSRQNRSGYGRSLGGCLGFFWAFSETATRYSKYPVTSRMKWTVPAAWTQRTMRSLPVPRFTTALLARVWPAR